MLQSIEKITRHKVDLLNLAEEPGNLSKACQMMGLSRYHQPSAPRPSQSTFWMQGSPTSNPSRTAAIGMDRLLLPVG